MRRKRDFWIIGIGKCAELLKNQMSIGKNKMLLFLEGNDFRKSDYHNKFIINAGIKDLLDEKDIDDSMVVIVASLGNETESEACLDIAKNLRDRGNVVGVILLMPFVFESPKRRNIADLYKALIKEKADFVFSFYNQKVMEMCGGSMSFLGAMQVQEQTINRMIEASFEVNNRDLLPEDYKNAMRTEFEKYCQNNFE